VPAEKRNWSRSVKWLSRPYNDTRRFQGFFVTSKCVYVLPRVAWSSIYTTVFLRCAVQKNRATIRSLPHIGHYRPRMCELKHSIAILTLPCTKCSMPHLQRERERERVRVLGIYDVKTDDQRKKRTIIKSWYIYIYVCGFYFKFLFKDFVTYIS